MVDSPVGKTLSLTGGTDSLVLPRTAIPTDDAKNVGEGDFTVAAWIHPQQQLERAAIVSLAGPAEPWAGIWNSPMLGARCASERRDRRKRRPRGVLAPGAIRPNAWQHVAVVVRRGRNETLLYVNGNLVARGARRSPIRRPQADLQIGNFAGAQPFQGDLADVRLYRRPLEAAEIQALLQPGKQLIQPPPQRPRGRRRPPAGTNPEPGRASILRRVAAACVPGGPARSRSSADPRKV